MSVTNIEEARIERDIRQGLENMQSRVLRGAALLDKKQPGWETWAALALNTLDMETSDRCILGVLFGDYTDGIDALGASDRGGPYYGFDVHSFSGESYKELTEFWKAQIRRRVLTPCENCSGTGTDPNSSEPCEVCSSMGVN